MNAIIVATILLAACAGQIFAAPGYGKLFFTFDFFLNFTLNL